MARLLGALGLAAGLLALLPARADEPAKLAAGNYKLVLPNENFFLIAFTESDGKWVGDFLGATGKLGAEPKIADAKFAAGVLTFRLEFSPRESLTFEGKPRPDGGVAGTLLVQNQLVMVRLEPTKLKDTADAIAVARDRLDSGVKNEAYFKAATDVVAAAKTKKVNRELAMDAIDKATKASAEFGPRFERRVSIDLLGAAAGQDGLKRQALTLAERAEKLIDPAGDLGDNLKAVDVIATAYDGLGQPEKAQKLRESVAQMEQRDYAEYSKKNPLLKSPAFAGRKAKSDKVVLVELFTGAECPPCVPVDLAFDGLEAVYKPSDVVFLQYHMHVPGPDALTVPDGLARAEFYGEAVRGTPALFFAGTPDGTGGGRAGDSKAKFEGFTKKLDTALEKEPGAKLALTATRKGKELNITAKVSGVAKPGPKVALRFAVVEERVRYAGGNGLKYHTSVVRAMPGGAKGFAVEKADLDKALTVDLGELQASIEKYLADFSSKEDEFPVADRAPAPRKLKVVAFVQDDASKDVLQAAAVEVVEAK